MSKIVVAALYHFVTLDNFRELRQPLFDVMLKHQVKGTLLLAQSLEKQVDVDLFASFTLTQIGRPRSRSLTMTR